MCILHRTYTGGEAPPIRTIQNTQAPPEFFSKFLTLPQIISTSLAKQKGDILYKNCTRIAKVTYYKNCTVQFLSRRYFVQFLCYVTYFMQNYFEWLPAGDPLDFEPCGRGHRCRSHGTKQSQGRWPLCNGFCGGSCKNC